ncbi:MAG: SagB/ThcOx family dehydrogenase [Candidatus Thermoplasmatota archaeon]|nr:SagB/ThcOx family dehydrogenase [Euryarchaeota archaeon]MBU4031587.1 SagB/ThcOx family dehydrogenase [Candidatus Thermoplasmatota archaeon]MBU4071638.1 SagB/ThcOx family dehydrogenase [Candidatus Thermoplasmatota archaeon]MBU4144694.1 SagB/ThcOx family dehydrogenase [Candidatus Thermoplasmatota archaeon]MBU4592673.1 SagB/ThcOx family dehydrogenase [Candidatus Thermoplasmatota archaeon]
MTRDFLKDSARKRTDFSGTDQNRGVPPPPIQKPVPEGATVIPLPGPNNFDFEIDLTKAIGNRKSRRSFTEKLLTLKELAFLLWASQGVRGEPGKVHAFRNVPSAGCRHALETYIIIFRVEGLEKGIYRYLPLDHGLVRVSAPEKLEDSTTEASLGQKFAGAAAATFVWTSIPYRMEWRYSQVSYKVIAIDAGHACQNLYLACEAAGCGTCAIAAYDQDLMDTLLGVDGDDEFTVYIAPVGKVNE